MGRVAWGRGGSWLEELAAALGVQGEWFGASVPVGEEGVGPGAVALTFSLVGVEGVTKGAVGACLPRISTLGEARSL